MWLLGQQAPPKLSMLSLIVVANFKKEQKTMSYLQNWKSIGEVFVLLRLWQGRAVGSLWFFHLPIQNMSNNDSLNSLFKPKMIHNQKIFIKSQNFAYIWQFFVSRIQNPNVLRQSHFWLILKTQLWQFENCCKFPKLPKIKLSQLFIFGWFWR